MATLTDRSDLFPHVSTRTVNDKPEPYLPGTGLAVWEIVWLWRAYEGDMDALMEHFRGLPITRELAGEALAYARTYPDAIDPVVTAVETMTLERLRELLPGIQPFPPDPENDAEPHS